MERYDVAVIGGGVIGCAVARELAAYRDLRVILLEKEDDVASGTTRANSGIVHAGYDCKPNTNKAKYNVEGNRMYYNYCAELGVKCKKTGSLVVADGKGLGELKKLCDKGIANGVDVEIIGRDRILEIEPNVADSVEYALYAKEAGIVSPYKLTIALADNAVLNGVTVRTESEVTDISSDNGEHIVTINGNEKISSKFIVNAAGGHAAAVNAMAGAERLDTVYRRGDYYLLDSTEGRNVNTVIFPLPDERGKGILVAPTASGNVIYGPTSIVVEDAEDTAVTAEGLESIRAQVGRSYKCPTFNKVIRVYAGVRSLVGDDFDIGWSAAAENFYVLAGICSPGLTAAPAIGVHTAADIAARTGAVRKSKDEIAVNPPSESFTQLTSAEINEKVKRDPAWGRLICRCEKVTEAEIVRAIHSPVPAVTVDAVKRRTRAGMGRCGGGFCEITVMGIIARELGIDEREVKKGGKESYIAVCRVKEAYDDTL